MGREETKVDGARRQARVEVLELWAVVGVDGSEMDAGTLGEQDIPLARGHLDDVGGHPSQISAGAPMATRSDASQMCGVEAWRSTAMRSRMEITASRPSSNTITRCRISWLSMMAA